MAIINYTNFVQNGLQLFYDFTDRKKSFINGIVTNYFQKPTPTYTINTETVTITNFTLTNYPNNNIATMTASKQGGYVNGMRVVLTNTAANNKKYYGILNVGTGTNWSVEISPYESGDSASFTPISIGASNSFTIEPRYTPTTQQTKNTVTFDVNGTGLFQRVTTGTYGGYSITPTDIVYRYDLGAAGCHYHGNDVITQPVGTWATFSFEYYVSPDATNYITTNLLANMENPGIGGLANAIAPNNLKGVWQTVSFSAQVPASGKIRFLLYPGGCSSSYLASSGFILYKNPQVTFDSSARKYTFIDGTTTPTKALKDITGNRTTTVFNPSFPSGSDPSTYSYLNSKNVGTASKTGVVVTDSSSILDTDYHSIFFMIRFNSTATYPNGYTTNYDKIFSFTPTGTDRSPAVWRNQSTRTFHWRYDPGNTGLNFGKNSSGTVFDLNTWYYVGVTKNGSTMTAYVNGASVASGTVASTKTPGSSPIYLFENNGAQNVYPEDLCSLGCVQVYDRVLTQEEITTNFTALRSKYAI